MLAILSLPRKRIIGQFLSAAARKPQEFLKDPISIVFLFNIPGIQAFLDAHGSSLTNNYKEIAEPEMSPHLYFSHSNGHSSISSSINFSQEAKGCFGVFVIFFPSNYYH